MLRPLEASAGWGLGVPRSEAATDSEATRLFDRYRERDWVVNSRNTADEDVVLTLASMADFADAVDDAFSVR